MHQQVDSLLVGFFRFWTFFKGKLVQISSFLPIGSALFWLASFTLVNRFFHLHKLKKLFVSLLMGQYYLLIF
jgi:hypothetical protein